MVTLKDLAQELKVSVSTVSKALSDSHEISRETKERVLELAKIRHYIPNNTAVNLRKRETKTIGVVIPNILNYFYTKILFGIELEAKKNGYKTIVSITNETLESEKEGLAFFSNGSVDGILLALSSETELQKDTKHIIEVKEKGIPLVMFDRYLEDGLTDIDKVVVNDFKSTKNAIKAFKNKGRKHIVIVSLLGDLWIGKLRKDGALSEGDFTVVESTEESEIEAQLHTILKDKKVDAILALDELSGVIALNMVKKHQYKVPEDIALISFSQGLLSTYSYPKLTTINQHSEKIGKQSVKLLLKKLNKELSDTMIKTISTDIEIQQTFI